MRATRVAPGVTIGGAGAVVFYPLRGIGPILILGLALLELVPSFGGLASLVISILFVVRVVRASARRKPDMPGWPRLTRASDWLRLWLEAFVVSLIVLWPITLAMVVGYARRSASTDLHMDWILVPSLFLGIFALCVYPACLALAALGNGVIGSLTPARIRGLTRDMGGNYGINLIVVLLGGFFLLILCAVLRTIPHAGDVLSRAASVYAQLLFARILGLTTAGEGGLAIGAEEGS